MHRHRWAMSLALAISVSACAGGGNPAADRDGLLAADRDWSASTGDTDKFLSFLAADASFYPAGMPVVTGAEAIRAMYTEMKSAPDFSLQWTPARAEAAGDLGHTTGSFQMTMGGVTERGKYVTLWRKENGAWKVTDDIFNADAPPPGAAHTVALPADVTWGDPPPSLPPGARLAVISGDPTKAGPFVIRLQAPAGYQVAAHWHPTDEHVTVLSGTFSVGMGDTFDAAALTNLPAGGYVALPGGMRHFAKAQTAATIQINGTGPFLVYYVNPADDPSKRE